MNVRIVDPHHKIVLDGLSRERRDRPVWSPPCARDSPVGRIQHHRASVPRMGREESSSGQLDSTIKLKIVHVCLFCIW
jgi:hypothetical protein